MAKVKFRMTNGDLILLDDIRPVLKDRIEELVKENGSSQGKSPNAEMSQALRAYLVNCLHEMIPDQQLLADLGTMSASFADGYRYAHLA